MQFLRLFDHSLKLVNTSCSYTCDVITIFLPVAIAVITVSESMKNIIIFPEIMKGHYSHIIV